MRSVVWVGMNSGREECVALRGSNILRLADPVLTLRLRSGQAHWANFCRAFGAGREKLYVRIAEQKNENWLHRDGVFRLARDVPARIALCVGENSASAGNIFLGSHRVDLEFRFVALVGNRQ